MGSSDPKRQHETRVTMRLIIASEGATEQVTTAARSPAGALWRYPLLLLLSVAGALIPFVAPLDLISVVPRIVVVAWYGLLALAAGSCGIIWILRAARLALSARGEADIPLVGEAQRKVFEALRSAVRDTET